MVKDHQEAAVLLKEEQEAELSVSEFVALLNQTLEFAYPSITISGEMANFRVSKNRWVYFDLKDETSIVKFFGTVYQLPGPLEDGMILKVRGQPKLHNLYGFSVNVMSIRPVGEGSLRRAADLLRAKLEAEGLFDDDRKRPIAYPPARIGLITSKQSAAYADFVKILNARWQGIDIELIDVQVQGEAAPLQIVEAIDRFNSLAEPPDVLVLIRGGGSAEDLAAYSSEAVTRAVAISRVPTLVAIGHEVDLSLAELSADSRASTPSNAAELLVPDRREVLQTVNTLKLQLEQISLRHITFAQALLEQNDLNLKQATDQALKRAATQLDNYKQLLIALNPESILRRGYAIVRRDNKAVRSISKLSKKAVVAVQLADGYFTAEVSNTGDGV
jgi:exodeoxyribonuclease VII large subunit